MSNEQRHKAKDWARAKAVELLDLMDVHDAIEDASDNSFDAGWGAATERAWIPAHRLPEQDDFYLVRLAHFTRDGDALGFSHDVLSWFDESWADGCGQGILYADVVAYMSIPPYQQGENK